MKGEKRRFFTEKGEEGGVGRFDLGPKKKVAIGFPYDHRSVFQSLARCKKLLRQPPLTTAFILFFFPLPLSLGATG